jgi:glyoxylase-like metal-dependent hydrolase (beta-lactamase superfamily II)
MVAMKDAPERQVAERVFEVAAGVFRIPLPTGYKVGDANVYVIGGPDIALVDAGVRSDDALGRIESALASIGRAIADVKTMLLTHGHVDHAGSARAIRERSGCEIRLHPRGHRRTADPAAAFQADMPRFLAFLGRSGFSERTIETFRQAFMGFLKSTEPCPDLLPAADGDVLTVAGGRRVEVVETPGHSADCVVYRLADAGVVFTGDTVLPHITSNPTLERASPDDPAHRPLVAYRASLRRVAALPDSIACPGHGRPFTGLAGRCEEILAHQAERCDRVVSILRESGPMTRKDLAIALFGKVPAWEIYLTLSEVQAAVGFLEVEGRIRVVADRDVDRVEAV